MNLILIVVGHSSDKVQQPPGNIPPACLQIEQYGAAALQQIHDALCLIELFWRADRDAGSDVISTDGYQWTGLRAIWPGRTFRMVRLQKQPPHQILQNCHILTPSQYLM